MDYTVHGILQARILEWVAFPFSRGPTQPKDRTQVSCIAGRFFFLPAELQWKPKSAGVGNLFLLQGIFLTQESLQVNSLPTEPSKNLSQVKNLKCG